MIVAMNGIINLDKPAGISSAKAVALVKKRLPRGVKIGHAGTLDPFATGVLLLLIGRATRLCERMMGEKKQYEATIRLGATTPTDDPESLTHLTEGAIAPPRDAVEIALSQFVGAIQQRPPAFSAMKVNGRRAYDLARRGTPVILQPRTVHVHAIDLLDYDWPLLRLRIDCGRGTYIRSLARDLGEALGVGGHLTELRRTRIGDFTIASAVTLEQIAQTGVEAHLQENFAP